MPDLQRDRADFELLWQALEARLPASQSEVYRRGLLGELLRGSDQTPLASDLIDLWIPGMAALGVAACFLPLSPTRTELVRPPNTMQEIFLFGFAGPLEFALPEEIDDTTSIPQDTDPQITAQARLLESPAGDFHWQNSEGPAEQGATLPTRFSHTLTLHPALEKTSRRVGVQAALHRWLAWYAAYPGRAPREGEASDPIGALAATFLHDSIGTRRDFVSNRLRYAAHCFEAAEISRAYRWLQEAAIAEWQLPVSSAEALRAPSDQSLSDMLRRELIYFARAGTLPLKTLAARRLTYERPHPDARKTLHQLCFDAHPWVRAAARPNSPGCRET
ncbi:MAG: hypothetical protein JWN14_3260 [Chthonomonadales bacterium]|nr:hypothetical protein [Chthonomonadales bacterium]